MHVQDIRALHEGRNPSRMKLLAAMLASGALLISTAAMADGTDDCPGTDVSALPFNDSGTTIGGNNTVNTIPVSCNGTYTSVQGADKIYQLVVSTPGSLTVTVTPSSGYDTSIYLLNGGVATCPAGTGNVVTTGCVAGSDSAVANGAETFTVPVLAAGTYHLFVDSFYSATGSNTGRHGPFTLSITGTAVVGVPDPDEANLSVTLTDAPDPVNVGDTITYTATVSNAGPDAADNVDLNIPLPAEVAFASITSGTATCTTPAVGASGTVNCDWTSIGASGGATVVITTTAMAPSATGGSGAVATATVVSDADDPNPANNSAITFTTINPAGPGPGGDQPVVATVPTLGTYATALLGALLGLFGFAAFRRRA